MFIKKEMMDGIKVHNKEREKRDFSLLVLSKVIEIGLYHHKEIDDYSKIIKYKLLKNIFVTIKFNDYILY